IHIMPVINTIRIKSCTSTNIFVSSNEACSIIGKHTSDRSIYLCLKIKKPFTLYQWSLGFIWILCVLYIYYYYLIYLFMKDIDINTKWEGVTYQWWFLAFQL